MGEFLRRHFQSPLTAVIVTAAILLAYLIWAGYQEAVKGAETNVRNLSSMIESRLEASLDRVRATLDEIAGRLDASMLRPDAVAANRDRINAELDAEFSHFPELGAFRTFDAAGDLIYTSDAATAKRINIADRPFFRRLRDEPGLDIIYSEVITARTNGLETVIVGKALRDAGGRFLGMASAQIKLDYFRDLFQTLDVGRRGLVSIRRSDDFTLVLRQPRLDVEINRSLPPGHAVRNAVAGGARESLLRASAHTDGINRIFGLRRLERAPFHVLAAVAEDDMLAHWRDSTLAVGSVGILLLVLLLLTRGVLRRSEGERAEAVDAVRQVGESLHLLSSVYEHSGEAMLITDAENRIQRVNQAFSRLTGYTLDDVLGANPSILSAGRTTADEYAAMWAAINERGHWQGEVWDRRKDGSCYPKWLRISTLKDATGRLTHYIGSFSDISERKAAEQHIHHLAHHDTLTGLLNRLSLQQRLEQAIASARRDGSQLAVMFVDLDHFKTINDTLGHPTGDKMLTEVARRLLRCVREADIVARLGGDEFVVVMTELTEGSTLHSAPILASKIVHRLSEPFLIDGYELHSTPSVGISVFPADGEDVETLMRNADTAMYHAKASGRNNFQFFTSAMNEAAAARMELEAALRQAVQRNEFVLHFQPQIDPSSRKVIGVEALVRWLHPTLGLLPPDRFIPLAEDNGLIEPLGNWILEAACRQLRHLRELGYGHLRVAVNISARQLRQMDFADRVARLLSAYEVPADRLDMEITESLATESPDATVALFRRLRGMGVMLSIDDFGTGYSSLGRLKLLPIQQIKLDRSFVSDIETDINDATICAATISLAHSLGLAVVGEGVENEKQLAFLHHLGCELIQGYYFSKPLPADRLIEFLAGSMGGKISAAQGGMGG